MRTGAVLVAAGVALVCARSFAEGARGTAAIQKITEPQRVAFCGQPGFPQPLYSAPQLAAMFTRPQTPVQALQGMKLAFDNNWLLQPGFYDEANLLKLFDADKVAWTTPNPTVLSLFTSYQPIEVTSNRGVFRQATIKLLRTCAPQWRHVAPHHDVVDHVRSSGYLQLSVAANPELTLGRVREVLGKETKAELNYGLGVDGPGGPRTFKGTLTYEDRTTTARERLARKYLIVRARLGPLPATRSDLWRARTLNDGDLVQSITIYQEGP